MFAEIDSIRNQLTAAQSERDALQARLDAMTPGVVRLRHPMDVEIEAELSKVWPVGEGWRLGFRDGVTWARTHAEVVVEAVVLLPLESAPRDRQILAYWKGGDAEVEIFADVVVWSDDAMGFICHCEAVEKETESADASELATIPRKSKWTEVPGLRAMQQAREIAKCPDCQGQGWYADRDPRAPEEPIQVQCERCRGTGAVQQAREVVG